MNVLDIAKKLNKEFKDDKLATIANVTPTYEKLPIGALGFDYPLFGGLPEGRIITFAGLFHSGKSTAACLAMSAYQRKYPEKTCVYIDQEHSLDLKFQARMTGIQLDKMIYLSPTTLTGEQVLDTILEFQKADNIGMIVLDSLPALLPAQSLENDMTKDPGMRGTIAKPLHRFLVAMSGLVSEKQNMFIMVNQVRVSGTTFTGAPIYTEPAGQAPAYYSSIKVRFGTRTFIKGDKVDASDGEGADGFRLKFVITKNKCGSVARGGGFISFSYANGLMWLDDMMEIASKFGFVQKNGAYCTLINLKTNEPYINEDTGTVLKAYMKDIKDYLKTHIAFQKEYVDMLNEYIKGEEVTYGDILDARESDEIKTQEEIVSQHSFTD